MRESSRSLPELVLIAGLFAMVGGGFLFGISVAQAGDWWLARQPLVGLGLNVFTLGSATTSIGAAVAIGRQSTSVARRIVLLAPTLAVLCLWLVVAFGLASSAPNGGFADVPTNLYSFPLLLLVFGIATLVASLPAVLPIARRRSHT